jgi:hypothetical protein
MERERGSGERRCEHANGMGDNRASPSPRPRAAPSPRFFFCRSDESRRSVVIAAEIRSSSIAMQTSSLAMIYLRLLSSSSARILAEETTSAARSAETMFRETRKREQAHARPAFEMLTPRCCCRCYGRFHPKCIKWTNWGILVSCPTCAKSINDQQKSLWSARRRWSRQC